jgi:hypothetical protein
MGNRSNNLQDKKTGQQQIDGSQGRAPSKRLFASEQARKRRLCSVQGKKKKKPSQTERTQT